jgi:hypothetical protein
MTQGEDSENVAEQLRRGEEWFDNLPDKVVSAEVELVQTQKPPPSLGKKHPPNANSLLTRPALPRGNGKGKAARKRKILWERQGGICRYCDEPLETSEHGTLDHIKSRYAGGTNAISNLALVCVSCNALKAWFSSYGEVEEFCEGLLSFFKRLQDRGIVP